MRSLLLAVAAVALVVALATAPDARHPGPPLRDFEAYYAAGQTWHYRGDPYGRDIWRGERTVPGVVTTHDELLPFVGPPYGLPLWSALGVLAYPRAVLVWTIVLALAFATLTLGSLRLAMRRLRPIPILATLAFGAAFAPITGGFALGQVALVSCAAVVALPQLLRPRGTLGATLATLVAGLQPNLALVLVARATDARARIAIATAALLALLGSALALGGAGAIARYARVVGDQGAAERFIAIQTTPGAVAYALGASPALAGSIALLLGAFVVVVLALQFARGAYAPDARLLLACAALPLALPFAHQHDDTIAFAPALVLVARTRGGAWLWSACAALALGIDWLGLVERPGGTLSTLALAVAGGCALVALAPERLRVRHAMLGAILGLVAGASAIARGHRLPVWPDALPATFHVAIHLPAAVVWGAEQAASGIARRDPVWGTLRTIDLIACAILWLVASVILRDEPKDARERSAPSVVG